MTVGLGATSLRVDQRQFYEQAVMSVEVVEVLKGIMTLFMQHSKFCEECRIR